MAKKNEKNENQDSPKKERKLPNANPETIPAHLAHLEKTNRIHFMGENHGKGAGRKPNRIAKFILDNYGAKVTKSQLDDALGMLAGLSPVELRDIADTAATSEEAAIVVILAKELVNAIDHGDPKNVWIKLVEFIRGRASERVEVSVQEDFSIEENDFEGLEEEEIEAFFKVTAHLSARRKMKQIAASGGAASDEYY